MEQRITDPLHGHCLCELHAQKFAPRRAGVKFFFIPPEAVPAEVVCGRCAPQTIVHGGLVVSEESLEKGVVTFLKNAAFSSDSSETTSPPCTMVWGAQRPQTT